jgi:hypothetical protein
MNVAITGHTSGLGKAFREIYPIGLNFSRSNGYDISYSVIQKCITDKSENANMFINNAYCGFSQADLLYRLCLKLGYIDTARVSNINDKKMNPVEVVDFVKGIIDINKSFWIPMITLYPT